MMSHIWITEANNKNVFMFVKCVLYRHSFFQEFVSSPAEVVDTSIETYFWELHQFYLERFPSLKIEDTVYKQVSNSLLRCATIIKRTDLFICCFVINIITICEIMCVYGVLQHLIILMFAVLEHNLSL